MCVYVYVCLVMASGTSTGSCRERRSSSAVRELVRRLVSGDDDDDDDDEYANYKRVSIDDVDEDEDEDGGESVDKPMLPPRPSDMEADIFFWEAAMLKGTSPPSPRRRSPSLL